MHDLAGGLFYEKDREESRKCMLTNLTVLLPSLYNLRLMERGQTLADFYAQLSRPITEMRLGSYTAELLMAGPPRIIKKCAEEMSESFQALWEQNDEQVNSEVSQTIYHLMLLMIAVGKGNMQEVVGELERKRSGEQQLPDTLGSAVRICGESVGEVFQTALTETSTDDEMDSCVADVFLNFQNAMAIAGKGSWENVLEKL